MASRPTRGDHCPEKIRKTLVHAATFKDPITHQNNSWSEPVDDILFPSPTPPELERLKQSEWLPHDKLPSQGTALSKTNQFVGLPSWGWKEDIWKKKGEYKRNHFTHLVGYLGEQDDSMIIFGHCSDEIENISSGNNNGDNFTITQLPGYGKQFCHLSVSSSPQKLSGKMILHFTNFDDNDNVDNYKHDIAGCGRDEGGSFIIRGVYEICNKTGYNNYVRMWKLYTTTELFSEYH